MKSNKPNSKNINNKKAREQTTRTTKKTKTTTTKNEGTMKSTTTTKSLRVNNSSFGAYKEMNIIFIFSFGEIFETPDFNNYFEFTNVDLVQALTLIRQFILPQEQRIVTRVTDKQTGSLNYWLARLPTPTANYYLYDAAKSVVGHLTPVLSTIQYMAITLSTSSLYAQ